MKKEKPFQITKRAVFEAFKKVKANKGAPGIDEVTLQEYENNLENNLYPKDKGKDKGTGTCLVATNML